MNQNEKEIIQARLKWVRLYEDIKDAGIVCRRCGISRLTLRKWLKRYANEGISGLEDQSRRPKGNLTRKVFEYQEKLILDLRLNRKLGVRRIQSELKRNHDFSVSLSTIHENHVFCRIPFSIQRIQTDRGGEFMVYKVQEKLREWRIKFRPVKPASPLWTNSIPALILKILN